MLNIKKLLYKLANFLRKKILLKMVKQFATR